MARGGAVEAGRGGAVRGAGSGAGRGGAGRGGAVRGAGSGAGRGAGSRAGRGGAGSRAGNLRAVRRAVAVCLLLTALTGAAQGAETNTTLSPQRRGRPGLNLDSRKLSDETRLVNMLLARYQRNGKVARPLYDAKKQIIVRYGLRLIQLDMIEKEQALKASVWVRCRWTDEYLRWRPRDYGGLMSVTLPWDKVWLPDVVLVNTAEAQTEERPADLMVDNTGRVFWAPHKVFKSACLIDVTNFPYDQHTCYMWFQSMSRYSWHLDLQPYLNSPWDLDTYLGSFKESQEWEIKTNLTERFTQSRDVGVLLKFSRRPALRFSLSVRRRLGYTCHLLMLPGVFLISMTLVVFCLPPERPDRHSLAMSLFGSFMVLLLILVEVAPPTAASIPKLGTYYACNMTLVMLSIFLSGTVVNVSRRGETRVKVPFLVKFVFIDILSYPLLLRKRVSGPFTSKSRMHDLRERSRQQEAEDAAMAASNASAFVSAQPLSQNVYNYPVPPLDAHPATATNGLNTNDSIVQMDRKLRHMETLVARMGTGDADADPLRTLKAQWRNVAVVMDRLFFLLYLIIIVTTLIVLFPWPNYS